VRAARRRRCSGVCVCVSGFSLSLSLSLTNHAPTYHIIAYEGLTLGVHVRLLNQFDAMTTHSKKKKGP